MSKRWLPCALVVILAGCTGDAGTGANEDIAAEIDAMRAMDGFVDMYWDDAKGRLLLAIDDFGEELLYQSSLARGVGSNDLGLDRGQLGATRIVRFERAGRKVLLIEENLRYRARSNDPAERNTVQESFAPAVLWGFESLGEADGATVVDATEFFLRDADDIAGRLTEAGEGTYATDPARSAVFLPRTRAFPDNSEIEAIVTFTGKPEGKWLPTVVSDARQFSVHLHHSFVRLPGPGYTPLPYDPRAGLIGLGYGESGFTDYAQPIGEPLNVAYARRHRLEKKDPAAAASEAVEPIVYYVDPGAPEPVRSALLEGASWWNAAFEAAGYRNAFRVELLPEGADPMDVRYNVIQWVHRSTRGWSYGASVVDPRTGEIIKGHVTLGSQRIRQDYMIAEGLLAPYDDGAGVPDDMLDMALGRIRQLAAHEVGHTLGLEHNFAGSTQGNTTVMDYPFPRVQIGEDGALDVAHAYDTGVGEWDKRVVRYAYQDFPEGTDADAERRRILDATIADGLEYVADQHSRDAGTGHPDGNLWDNGEDAVAELERLLEVRALALERFGERNLRPGRPLARLEDVLVPIYLLHRYQVEAVGKLIGGEYFAYALRGDGQTAVRPVLPARQQAAIDALLRTLSPEVLRVPPQVLALLPPRPPGHPETRELFPSATGAIFDPLGPAATGAALTADVLLEPSRAARLDRMHALHAESPGFADLLEDLLDVTWRAAPRAGFDGALQRTADNVVLVRLLKLAGDLELDPAVQAAAIDAVNGLDEWLASRLREHPEDAWRAHYERAAWVIDRLRENPDALAGLELPEPPPGSPIGM
ncbi:MAG TPA: zinc-dependent metalloprotease [Woeseiaceae bacterium]